MVFVLTQGDPSSASRSQPTSNPFLYHLTIFRLICADCLMFGPNKGDEVVEPEKGIELMNEKFKVAEKKGLLRNGATDSILLDIRQTILSFKESK